MYRNNASRHRESIRAQRETLSMCRRSCVSFFLLKLYRKYLIESERYRSSRRKKSLRLIKSRELVPILYRTRFRLIVPRTDNFDFC
uniref:Uncharacterized protein n=1 Tax=Trichogramma kaykai TaxID=54128 RepID=A0ABD2X872_9HYME